MHAAPALSIASLERQLRVGTRRVRFAGELEPLFLADHGDAVAGRRLSLIAASLVLVGIAPMINAFVLHPPDAFNGPALLAQFGLMIPALLLAALFTGVRRLRRWQDPVAAFAAFAVVAGVLMQRHVGAALGFVVPVELVSVVLLGTAVLSGLRAVWCAPAMAAIVAAFAMNEIATFGAGPQTLSTLIAIAMMAGLAAIGSYMEERRARSAWLQRKLLEELAVRDALSGLPNARSFHDSYPRLHAAAARASCGLLVAMLDIDYFKNYNDRYGHVAGDECIRRVAQVLPRHGRRATDIQARIGGEEFVMVWYDVHLEHAAALLEAVRAEVESLELAHAARPDGPARVTVSIGAAHMHRERLMTHDAQLRGADQQLYRSKQNGRNRVSLHLP